MHQPDVSENSKSQLKLTYFPDFSAVTDFFETR